MVGVFAILNYVRLKTQGPQDFGHRLLTVSWLLYFSHQLTSILPVTTPSLLCCLSFDVRCCSFDYDDQIDHFLTVLHFWLDSLSLLFLCRKIVNASSKYLS